MSIILACVIALTIPTTGHAKPKPNPHDADTYWVEKCDKRVKPLELRVSQIDAPEFPAFTWGLQPGAFEARAEAMTICAPGAPVKVRLKKLDGRTKRWIADMECNGMDLSHMLAASGTVWAYLPDKKSDVPALVRAAQDQQVGLWRAGNVPVAPSVWRKLSLHQCPDGSAKPRCP